MMEYVFGRDNASGRETLRTKGAAHTDLQGFQEVVREFDDCTITDSFRVVRHYKEAEDVEGNCYDWYEIDSRYRMIDRKKAIEEENRMLRAQLTAATDRQDFLEDCIAEMAMQVYSE